MKKLLIIFIFFVMLSYVLELSSKNKVLADALNIPVLVPSEPVREVEAHDVRVKPFLVTETLPEAYNERKEMVFMYLRYLGESEADLITWDRIIQTESNFNQFSEAPTQWKQCSDGGIIELTQYEGGYWWQDYCENYGLTELRSGTSKGLLHIIAPTWEWLQCEGDINNWMDELKCGVKIKRGAGFSQWASY
jgi:hypothetical protein